MSLQRRRERYCILVIFKILHNIIPNDVGLIFVKNDRRGVRVKLPSIHRDAKMKYTTQYDDSFPVRAAKLWNTLPPALTTKNTMESFKPAVTSYLQSFPDHPPIQGLSSRNSLLDLNIYQRGCCGHNLQ
jgi:hypothetical protein